MANNNGQLLLHALQNFEEPATAAQIVSHIADSAGTRPRNVKDSVEETLNGGVRFGYIQRSNRKYFVTEGVEGNAQTDEQEDRSRRRRRGRGRGRGRGRRGRSRRRSSSRRRSRG